MSGVLETKISLEWVKEYMKNEKKEIASISYSFKEFGSVRKKSSYKTWA